MYTFPFLQLKFYIDFSVKHLFCQLSNFLYCRLKFFPLPKVNLIVILDFSSNLIFQIQILLSRIHFKWWSNELCALIFLVDIQLSIERLASIVVHPQKWFFNDFLILPLQYLNVVLCFSRVLVERNRNQLIKAEIKVLKWYLKIHKL